MRYIFLNSNCQNLICDTSQYRSSSFALIFHENNLSIEN